MTLRPNDYDRNGDIIPDSVREDKGDLISRDALWKKTARLAKPVTILEVLRLIDNAPTVTVDNYAMGYQDGVRKVLSKRPQGEWIKIDPYPLQMHEFKCSECGYETDDCTDNFCSYCGARMRGEND